jgi:hypothetical protein
LIKRTDAEGNWCAFDTARGIVSGNDPLIYLNTNIPEASFDFVDPDSTGFAVTGVSSDINENGAAYIYLAIA